MTDALDRLDEDARKQARRKAFPEWNAPMLATLVDDAFSDPDWLYERKLDGERALAFCKGGKVRLMTRNRKEIGDTYPELAEALSDAVDGNAVLDGEIVAFDGKVTSFSKLQGRMQISDPEEARRSGICVYFYLFDILHHGRHDLSKVPLRSRKRMLKRAVRFAGPLRYTPHRNEDGEAWLEEACRKGWEGLIAKRADSPYRHGRSRDWLKFKCGRGQELVICGFTKPKGSRTGFGALLLGYYEDGRLRYAGRVGTGFDEKQLKSLHERLARLARESSPFDDTADVPTRGVTFVTPKVVAEIGFTEWTHDGRLRHPRFLGLRRDKKASDVVRERPKSAAKPK